MPILEIITGPLAGTRFALSNDREAIIGRDGSCHIVLTGASVSRKHARIVSRSNGFCVEDLRSINGTFVNSQRVIKPTELRHGDRINIHDTTLVFHAVEATPSDGKKTDPALDVPDESSPPVHGNPETVILGADTHPEFVAFRPEAQIRSILKISQQLCRELNVDKVLPEVLDLLFETFPTANNGRILLKQADGKLRTGAFKQGREDDSAVFDSDAVSDRIFQHVLETGEIAVEASGDPSSVLDAHQMVTITAPIVGPSDRVLGVIHLELAPSENPLGTTGMEFLSAVGYATGQAVELHHTHLRLLETDRNRNALLLAHEVQQQMLPTRRPNIAGYSLHDHYAPAYEVGGDFFGYFTTTDGGIVVTMGDVCGKGVSAALMMAALVAETQHALTATGSVKRAMGQLNRVARFRKWRLVTFVMCVLDPVQHRLTVANAGHYPPMCRRQATGTVENLQPKRSGMPLGVLPKQEFHPQTFSLDPGDTVLLFTDGLNETKNREGRIYGCERVKNALAGITSGPRQVIRFLLSDAADFRKGLEQDDDLCLVCLRRNSK